MSDRIVGRGLAALTALAAVACLALCASRAEAATVVNGNFETGNLNGWTVFNDDASGDWFAYTGTETPFGGPAPAPPQGQYAAITAQTDPGAHVLFQDIALEPGATHALSLLAYYESDAPILDPATLESSGSPNQQYRIDVIRQTAPLLTVAPGDILATPFRTKVGDPQSLAPQRFTVDLTPFAGQIVRLRMAEVDNQGIFNAGVDDVTVTSTLPPVTIVPSNVFSFGKLKLNKKNGTATLKVNVPGAGTLTAVDAKKKAPKRIKKVTATISAAGVATLKLKPTGAGKKALKNKGKVKFKALVTFTPTGGTAATQPFKGRLVRLQG